MATKSISQLDTQATANETDLFEVAIVDANSASGYASKKESAAAIADAIVGEYQYPLRITGTTAKTIAGAINELKNLVDLLPQFAIEVVQTLPVSDISTTTIYLVPAQDPEQGNYYEEYIYVNNAWELVGTTAVDLSGYYTSAQVDTLLAAKANTSSLATVATSGAYSDLSGKPTIDTALDNTSTNAVENRAVASEINSIKSDITVEGSASGDIATFVDGSDNPLKELKISIVAQQSGSGDPSPTNVRPITGWTSANIYVNNKNFVNIADSTISSTGYVLNNVAINVPKGSFVLSFDFSGTTGSSASIRFDDENGNVVYTTSKTVTSGKNAVNITLNTKASYIKIYSQSIGTYSNFQIEKGAQATDYVALSQTINNINWQSTAGTVYGGTLNVRTGVLTVDAIKITLDSTSSWSQLTGYITSEIIDGMAVTDKYAGMCNWLHVLNSIGKGILIGSNTRRLYVGNEMLSDLSLADVDAWITYLGNHPLEVTVPLATPITYQLTPTEIRSLLGLNNVFADCGAVTELKYTRDLNLCINDIISRIEALEGGSNTRSLYVSPTLTKSIVSDSDTTEGILEGKTEETEEETKEEAQNER